MKGARQKECQGGRIGGCQEPPLITTRSRISVSTNAHFNQRALGIGGQCSHYVKGCFKNGQKLAQKYKLKKGEIICAKYLIGIAASGDRRIGRWELKKVHSTVLILGMLVNLHDIYACSTVHGQMPFCPIKWLTKGHWRATGNDVSSPIPFFLDHVDRRSS